MPRKKASVSTSKLHDEEEEYDFSHLVRGDAPCTEKIEWYWDRRIQKGALNMFEGEPGAGKSTLLTALAATISEGGRFPKERTTWRKGKVLWFGSEERFLAKVSPRFAANGGHSNMLVNWPNSILQPSDMISLPHDRDKLIALLKREDATVLVADPFTALSPFGADTISSDQMRPYLEAIFAATAPLGVTTLLSRHWNKDKNASAINKGGGSISISAVCRVIHAVTKNIETQKPGIMSPVKVNDEEERPPIAFSFTRTTHAHARLNWGKDVEKTIGEIIQENANGGDEDAATDAVMMLTKILANGKMPAAEIIVEGNKVGISPSTLRRAKKKLKIKSQRVSRGGKGEGCHYWLPPSKVKGGAPDK